MRRITFDRIARIKDGSYRHYAAELRNRFYGRKSAMLTKENAIWCAGQCWCTAGGARVLLGGYGSPLFKKWRELEFKLEVKLDKKYPIEGVNFDHENYRRRREERWMALFRFANRAHETKRKLRAVRKVTRVRRYKQPSLKGAKAFQNLG